MEEGEGLVSRLLTCPSSDSGDEDSTIPLVVGDITEGVRAMVW